MERYIIHKHQPFQGSVRSATYIDSAGIERVQYSGYLSGAAEDLTLENYLEERAKEGEELEVITSKKADQLFEQYERGFITKPTECTENDYTYVLEVLPPKRYQNGTFCMIEHLFGNITKWYAQRNGKYYTWQDFAHANPQEALAGINAQQAAN